MAEGLDAGLEELTSDVLRPNADSVADPNTAAVEQDAGELQEPIATAEQPLESAAVAPPQAQADATQQAPIPAKPEEQKIEIDLNDGRGPRQYTREQLAQTLRQFPHLQNLYTQAKAQLESKPQQAPAPPDPRQILSNIRASFDGEVAKAVEQGFVEEDLATLYPNFMASAMLMRDSLTAVQQVVRQQGDKIQWYESQNQVRELRSSIDNNMMALAGEHEAFRPLGDPSEREGFFQFLAGTNADVNLVLQNRDYLISQWVAYKRNDYLGGFDKLKQQTAAATTARTQARRAAQGAPITGSRPSAAPTAPATALDEMVEDFFAR